jgi:hypothetical protein
VFRDREAGSSKMTARIAVEAVWKVPALKLRRAPRNGPAAGRTP